MEKSLFVRPDLAEKNNSNMQFSNSYYKKTPTSPDVYPSFFLRPLTPLQPLDYSPSRQKLHRLRGWSSSGLSMPAVRWTIQYYYKI